MNKVAEVAIIDIFIIIIVSISIIYFAVLLSGGSNIIIPKQPSDTGVVQITLDSGAPKKLQIGRRACHNSTGINPMKTNEGAKLSWQSGTTQEKYTVLVQGQLEFLRKAYLLYSEEDNQNFKYKGKVSAASKKVKQYSKDYDLEYGVPKKLLN